MQLDRERRAKKLALQAVYTARKALKWEEKGYKFEVVSPILSIAADHEQKAYVLDPSAMEITKKF